MRSSLVVRHRTYRVVLTLVGVAAFTCAPLRGDVETVRLQLKWKHQFQFAGYYAAQEEGFYRDAGLRVELQEARPDAGAVDVVLRGDADYGVGTSELVVQRSHGKPVVALAAVFQHSPLIMLAARKPGLESVHDLVGKRVMMEADAAELTAYLAHEGVAADALEIIPHGFSAEALLRGEADALSAYSTDEPFVLQAAGCAYLTFTPRSGGIDFYGDTLFTTEAEIRDRPERVEAFLEASLQGWRYALKHPDEMIDLILERYGDRHSREHLAFEAEIMQRLILPEIVEVGYMQEGRWRHIADTYAEMGVIAPNTSIKGLMYSDPRAPDARVYIVCATVLVFAMCVGFVSFRFFRMGATIRRQADAQKRMAMQVGQKQRLESLGVLSRGLAHEMNNPLNGVLNYVELAQEEDRMDAVRQHLSEIRSLAVRTAGIVRRLLDFSSTEAESCDRLLVADALGGAVFLMQSRLERDEVTLKEDIPADIPAVCANRAQLQQVFVNLLMNACEALCARYPDKQEARQASVSAETVKKQGTAYVRVTVADRGDGLDEETSARAFEPFFTSRGRSGHSGLGLSVSHGIVQSYGGSIAIEQAQGMTRVIVDLPAV